MRWKKGLISLMSLTVVTSLALTGCSDQEASNKNGETVEPGENFNATGFPVVDEKITLTVKGGYNQTNGAKWNEKKLIQQIEEKTNIHADWQLTPVQGWGDKQNLLLAGGDLPDVMLNLNLGNITKYGAQGALIPLEDLIKKYAPNLSRIFEEYPAVRRLVTSPDGHIYILPRVDMSPVEISPGNNLWINKEWLKNVGMDMPTTTAEFKKVLEAFKTEDANGNGDPNDEIPFSFIWGDSGGRSNSGLVGAIYGSFGIVNTRRENTLVVDGKVKYVPIQPELKKGIKYLHSLYAKGLIDPEVFSQESPQYVAKLSAKTPKVGVFAGAGPASMVNSDSKWDYTLINPPLKGPSGSQIKASQFYYMNRRAIAITSANEHPAATIRWLDQIYDPEMSWKFRYGPNGIKQLDNGKWKITPPEEGYNPAEWQYKESPVNDFAYAITPDMAENLIYPDVPHAKSMEKRPEFLNRVKEYFHREWKFPLILYSAEELDELDRYKTDIQNYAQQTE
ncbi:MAG TPA: extracellular solute-binding protein, partial [Bacillales bacterium]